MPCRSSRDHSIPHFIASNTRSYSTAKWQPSETGREAKYYDLTAKGRAFLKIETENWKRLTGIVGLILKGTLEGIS